MRARAGACLEVTRVHTPPQAHSEWVRDISELKHDLSALVVLEHRRVVRDTPVQDAQATESTTEPLR